MPWEVIDRVHSIANAQRMPANIIFTDAEGNILDDDSDNVGPADDPDADHRSVDPTDRIYMGLRNPQDDPLDDLPPIAAKEVALPDLLPIADDNYSLPLADNEPEGDDGAEGVADGIVGDKELGPPGGVIEPAAGNGDNGHPDGDIGADVVQGPHGDNGHPGGDIGANVAQGPPSPGHRYICDQIGHAHIHTGMVTRSMLKRQVSSRVVGSQEWVMQRIRSNIRKGLTRILLITGSC